MTDHQQNRKNEHVSIAQSFYSPNEHSAFANLKFVHHNFPNMAVSDVDLSTKVCGLQLDYPFYINAMTGGSEWTKTINQQLSRIANKTGLAMAVGSQSVAIREPKTAESFTIVREENPDGVIFANIGANHDEKAAKTAVKMIDADALQVHINAPQEIIMPEGDRDFSRWKDHFQHILDEFDIPVIFKEVGFGFSEEALQKLYDLGAQAIDLGGRGGTNFAQIENSRRKEQNYEDLLNWGQTTPQSLLEAQNFVEKIDVLASGGVKTASDIVKALALGAKAVGLAGEFLNTLIENGEDALYKQIESLKEEVASIMTLLSARQVSDLVHTDLLVLGETKEYCDCRDIDYKHLSRRYGKR